MKRTLLTASMAVALTGCAGLKLTLINSSVRRPGNIAMYFSVDRTNGQPVGGLTADRYTIFEDDRPVSALESRQTILNPQVAAVHYTLLLMDMSGSVTESGQVPQVCLLFGPSAAGGAYIPAFCDVVVMVEGNASMYLGSPRMAEMVINEKVTLEEMGGAKMHCSVSGCGDVLAKSEDEALAWCKKYLAFMPSNFEESTPDVAAIAPKQSGKTFEQLVPADENKPFKMLQLIEELIDEGSWLEVKKLFAQEILTGFARIDGMAVGIVANNPYYKGGVLFVDSADKAARFIWLCDAFNIPLLYLADVPGFMIGSKVEQQGIIRAGAKMIAAVSEASVPKLSVIVRKAYGAGLYAMCGPAFEPDACIALPTASIAVMGPNAAVNAVHFNKIQEVPAGPERDAFVTKLRDEYRANIDLLKLAAELVVDSVVQWPQLRGEIVARFKRARRKRELRPAKKHIVPPV